MHHTASPRREHFESLAAEVYEPIQRYVRRRVDADAVDDVVADTMLTLWRRLGDIPPNAQLPWAYGVARRQIANQRRSAGRHLRLLRRVQAEPRPAIQPEGPLDAELHAAMATLPDHEQELLRLWAWEQLEPAEIGVAMGLTANAVSIRLHRAKKRLAEHLEITRKNETSSGHSHREHSKEERS